MSSLYLKYLSPFTDKSPTILFLILQIDKFNSLPQEKPSKLAIKRMEMGFRTGCLCIHILGAVDFLNYYAKCSVHSHLKLPPSASISGPQG
jgi:hypothetical protein